MVSQKTRCARHKTFIQVDVGAWQEGGLSPFNRAVALLILAAALVTVIETERSIRERFSETFYLLQLIFGILFVCEYLVRLWVVGEDSRYSGVKGRLRYVISPIALVDLLAIVPFLATAGLEDAFLLRLFRLLRLLTLAKLGRYSEALNNIRNALYSRRYELYLSVGAAVVVMLMAASVMHVTEGRQNPESFGSIPRAMWWGVATVTKVGYAGAFPVTILGKLFAGIFAIAAVGVVAIPTGILAASFGYSFRQEANRRRGHNQNDEEF